MTQSANILVALVSLSSVTLQPVFAATTKLGNRACTQEDRERESIGFHGAIDRGVSNALNSYLSLHERINAIQKIEDTAFARAQCGDAQVKAAILNLKNIIIQINEHEEGTDPNASGVILAAANNLLDIASFYRGSYEGRKKPYLAAVEAIQALVDAFIQMDRGVHPATAINQRSRPNLRPITERLGRISDTEKIPELSGQVSWATTTLIALANSQPDDLENLRISYREFLSRTEAARGSASEGKYPFPKGAKIQPFVVDPCANCHTKN